MTVTVPPDAGSLDDPQPPANCSLCASPMAADQEWCLECGAARTVIARPPDWRIPVLVIAAVVLLIAGGVALAVVSLSNTAGKVTLIGATTATGAPTAATRIGTWPPGLDGYTVLLSHTPTQAAADSAATKVIASGIPGVGVISTAVHPVMKPANVYYVFVGRFPTLAAAKIEQAQLIADGQPTAKAALVQKPGAA